MGDPEAVFLDEPTTSLNPEYRFWFWEYLRRQKFRGMTIVASTHLNGGQEPVVELVGGLSKVRRLPPVRTSSAVRVLGVVQVVEPSDRLVGRLVFQYLQPSFRRRAGRWNVVSVVPYLVGPALPGLALPGLATPSRRRGTGRHRAGFAYSQRSQRFVSESDSPFVLPPALSQAPYDEEEGAGEARRLLEDALEQASTAYEDLVSALNKVIPEDRFEQKTDRRKAVRQAARAVLPNATETKIFVTANVRAWRHFIEMRGAAYADWEIRRLALRVLEILREESPLLFGDFEVSELPDGTSIAESKYPKV